jgi:chromosome segregation ATPase
LSITTIEGQIAQVRDRIDLQARAEAGANGGALRRIRRHLDALHEEQASVRAAAAHAPDEVEERLERLKSRLDIAEHSLTADVAGDWVTFAGAVEEELRSWDTYLERLQTSVASTAVKVREQAEAAIGDVRSRRISVGERLAQACDGAGDGGQEQRKHVTAGREELAQMAHQAFTKLN